METVTRKRMLYKTRVDYSTDAGDQLNDYAMNHVLGCSHGCKYPCYAMSAALRRKQVESYEDWCNPKLVDNALELLKKELARKKDVRRVHLCFTTDPLPYIPEDEAAHQESLATIQDATMRACELINDHGVPVTLLTKGVLPRFEFGEGGPLCLEREGYSKAWENPHPDNYYGVSLVSLNERFREEWEPNTAPYAERIASLRALHDAGLKTWVSMEPFPALTSRGHWERYGLLYEANSADVAVVLDLAATLPSSYDRGHKPVWYDSIERRVPDRSKDFYALGNCLRRVSFVDRIVFGRWNYNKSMPTDVSDVDAWYRGAAKVVREFCVEHGIEYVIKEGVE